MINSNDFDFFKKSLPFWDKLTDTQKDMMLEHSKHITHPIGTILHCGESDCAGILLIKKGTLRIYIISEEGREVTLYRLDDGEICILSASCIIDEITFDVYIDAETECDLFQICPNMFSKISNENIYVENYYYKITAERFSEAMWTMQQILFTSFDKRLASFLLDESNKTKKTSLTLTHEQIAKYLGSAREVVSRMLKYFSKEGYVSLERKTINIIDKKGLLKIVNKD